MSESQQIAVKVANPNRFQETSKGCTPKMKLRIGIIVGVIGLIVFTIILMSSGAVGAKAASIFQRAGTLRWTKDLVKSDASIDWAATLKEFPSDVLDLAEGTATEPYDSYLLNFVQAPIAGNP